MPNLYFEDNTKLGITLLESPIESYVRRCFKHLQYIDIDFKDWDNPYCKINPEKLLVKYAKKLDISIDEPENIKNNQDTLNFLHEIYEKNYDGNPIWLEFHEQIHQCESKNSDLLSLKLEWREKGGLLNSKIKKSTIDEYGTINPNRGDLFVSWAELGKLPFDYWIDGEPDNFNRLCELAKPWITLRPRFKVYFEDYNTLTDKIHYKDDFDMWWKKFKNQWCDHWNLDEYDFETQHKVIKVGVVDDMNLLEKNLKKFNNPKKVIPK